MEQIVEILKLVETPLQLAAVALLVFYAIAKALIATKRWKPSDAIIKVLLDRAFVLGLIALVLAGGGPLLVQGLNRDDLIDGSVSDQDGKIIHNATVSTSSGQQAVQLGDSYEIRVPDHFKRQEYVVTANADGYKTLQQTVTEAHIGAVDFHLQPQKPEHAVRQILPDLIVGQFLGEPFVIVSLQAKSPGNTSVLISEITAQLSNGYAKIILLPKAVTTLSNMGPYRVVTDQIPINPNIPTTFRFIMAPNADAEVIGLRRSLISLPEYRINWPCTQSGTGSSSELTDQAFDMVQSFAQSKFIWKEGNWTLHFQITAGEQQDTLDKPFELSSEDVHNLKDSIKLVKSCQTFFGTSPLAQDGMLSNYLVR